MRRVLLLGGLLACASPAARAEAPAGAAPAAPARPSPPPRGVAGKPAIVSYARSEKRGIDHQLTALDRATFKVLAKKVLHADAETGIKYPVGPFKPLWWHDGYTLIATLKAGEFDKARDMRRPD